MEYFELVCMIYVKSDFEFDKSFEIISKYISFSTVKGGLDDFHEKSGFKHYVYGGLLPIQKDKIYKNGSTYSFTIRSLNENFIDVLSTSLRENIDNPNFLVIKADKKTVKQFFISELYSATPVISIKDGKYWTLRGTSDIVQLQKQLHDNLEKKYQSFFNKELKSPQNFIQLIELKTKFVQKIQISKNICKAVSQGKNSISFLGNKFKIVPNEDELSQKLAFTALACGLGEKNSYGGGFCLVKGVRF